MPPEKEKAYIKKEIETIARICGEPPKGVVLWAAFKQIPSSSLGSLQGDGRSAVVGLRLIR
jgi:hypothetical protein